MDKALINKNIVRKYLEDSLGFPNRLYPDLKDYVIVDESGTHFIHLLMGWEGEKYVYTALRHLEVQEHGIILVHQEQVDKPVELDLERLGVSRSMITRSDKTKVSLEVLNFQ